MSAFPRASWTHCPPGSHSEGILDFDSASSIRILFKDHHRFEPRGRELSSSRVLSMYPAYALRSVLVHCSLACLYPSVPSFDCLCRMASRQTSFSQGWVPLNFCTVRVGIYRLASVSTNSTSDATVLSTSVRPVTINSWFRRAAVKPSQSAFL